MMIVRFLHIQSMTRRTITKASGQFGLTFSQKKGEVTFQPKDGRNNIL